jgi:hypothetical protein
MYGPKPQTGPATEPDLIISVGAGLSESEIAITPDAALALVFEIIKKLFAGPLEPLQLDGLIPAGHYRSPTAVQVKGVAMPGATGPAQIHLALADGYELDIPVTQHVIDQLYTQMRSMTTRPD